MRLDSFVRPHSGCAGLERACQQQEMCHIARGDSPIRKIVVKIPADGHQGHMGQDIFKGLNTTGRAIHDTAVAMNQIAAHAHSGQSRCGCTAAAERLSSLFKRKKIRAINGLQIQALSTIRMLSQLLHKIHTQTVSASCLGRGLLHQDTATYIHCTCECRGRTHNKACAKPHLPSIGMTKGQLPCWLAGWHLTSKDCVQCPVASSSPAKCDTQA